MTDFTAAAPRFELCASSQGPLPAPALDADQRAVLTASEQASVLALGGAGTGKTTTLVESVVGWAQRGTPLERQVLLAPTRRLAQALRTQVVRRLGGAHVAVRALTGHGLAQAIVTRHGGGTFGPPKLLTAPEQEFRIRQLLAHHDTSAWPRDVAAAAGTATFAAEVRTVAAKVRQLGLDPQDVAELGQRDRRPEWVAFADFFANYLDVLDSEGVLDYAEVVHRARLLVQQPEVAAELAGQVAVVQCDDLAEFDPSQVQLLADLVHLGIPLVATGDPTTSVFGFRGADQRVLTDFDHIFTTDTRPAVVTTLTTNHAQTAPVAAACALVEQRLPRPPAFRPADPPASRLGQVRAQVFDSPGAEAEHIAHALRRAHLHDGIDWADMAVITRSRRGTLALLGRTLTTHDVPVHVAADDIALGEAPAVRPLLSALQAALTLAEGGRLEPDLTLGLLRSPLGGLDPVGVRRLGRALRAAAVEQHLDTLTSPEWISLLVAQPDAFDHLPPSPEAEAARALGRLLREAARLITEDATSSVVLWQVWNATGWPHRLRETVLTGGDGAVTADRDLDAVSALFDLAARDTTLTGARASRHLLDEVGTQQIAADHAREAFAQRRGVQLLTAHRAKGERFRFVVVAGVQEGVWPNHRRGGTLLAADQLGREGVTEPEPFSARLAAERRLFLLAASRASEQLLVTACRGTEGEGDRPSRFLDELGVEVATVLGRPERPLTLSALVADLRRCVTDPEQSPALREAAAARLARLMVERDRWGRPLVPAADPARWWGMRDYTTAPDPAVAPHEPVVLRGSEVESILTCPRQWFLSRQARAEQGRGSASSLGSVIHVLVDHASSEGLDADELSAHLDQIWSQIPFDAAWLTSSERAEADAALQRYALWAEENRRTMVGSEVPFRVRVPAPEGPIVLMGTVDRLDLDDHGRLHVVDFKTGRSAPTAAEAARLPQLGVYQLAAQLGAFADLAPQATGVGGAELVYLRQDKAGRPKVLPQPSLDDEPWAANEEATDANSWAHEVLIAAARVVRSEEYPAHEGKACQWCPFELSCPARHATEVVN